MLACLLACSVSCTLDCLLQEFPTRAKLEQHQHVYHTTTGAVLQCTFDACTQVRSAFKLCMWGVGCGAQESEALPVCPHCHVVRCF